MNGIKRTNNNGEQEAKVLMETKADKRILRNDATITATVTHMDKHEIC